MFPASATTSSSATAISTTSPSRAPWLGQRLSSAASNRGRGGARRSREIWRDPRIGGADDFGRDLDRQLRASAMLLAILSPGYLDSAWCEWELEDSPAAPLGSAICGSTRNAVSSRSSTSRRRRSCFPRRCSSRSSKPISASGHAYEMKGGSDQFNRLLTDLGLEIGSHPSQHAKSAERVSGNGVAPAVDQRERVRQELEARDYRVLTAVRSLDDTRIVRAAVKESSLSILFDGRAISRRKFRAIRWPPTSARWRRRKVRAKSSCCAGRPDTTQATSAASPQSASQNVEWLFDPPAHTLYHTVLADVGNAGEARGRAAATWCACI